MTTALWRQSGPGPTLPWQSTRQPRKGKDLNQGLKPRGEGAHALLAEAVGSQLASALDLSGFGWMRTTRNATEYGSDRHPIATVADVDEAVDIATTIHYRARVVMDHMYPY